MEENNMMPGEETTRGMKFCENCGAPLQPGTKFCDNCGHKIVYVDAGTQTAASDSAAAFPVQVPEGAEGTQEQAAGFSEEAPAQTFPEETPAQGNSDSFQGSAQQGTPFQGNTQQGNTYQGSTQQGGAKVSSRGGFSPKIAGVIAYLIPVLGCALLYFACDREDDFVKHHLNQSLLLGIIQIVINALRLSGTLGLIIGILILGCRIYGLYGAATGQKTEIPYLSNVKLF